jgi:uncharacterized protein
MEWDEEKDAVNRAKHGVGLGEAVLLEWDERKEYVDNRSDYGEERYIAHARIGDRLHVCVYVVRDGSRRIISLRKANRRERLSYGV